jgi:hypothetical protein
VVLAPVSCEVAFKAVVRAAVFDGSSGIGGFASKFIWVAFTYHKYISIWLLSVGVMREGEEER